VSVVIRAKNEAALIGACLSGVFGQDFDGLIDVLVIDSGSSDQTIEIAKSFGDVRVICIPPATFNYGAALNLGVRETSGEYVVAISAHCVPLDNHWLAKLAAPLEQDPGIAATFGRQVAWPHSDAVESRFLKYYFGESDREFGSLAANAHPLDSLFSNANSCMRRSLLTRYPFEHLPWAEDRYWAHQVLASGHRIRYQADAAVYHSHERSVRGYFSTGRSTGRTRRQLHAPRTKLSSWDWSRPRKLGWLMRELRKTIKEREPTSRWPSLEASKCLVKIAASDLGCLCGELGW
jgi:glycosyltransferase involved in cell wall biosynthesis